MNALKSVARTQRVKTIFANNVLIYFFIYFRILELEVPGTWELRNLGTCLGEPSDDVRHLLSDSGRRVEQTSQLQSVSPGPGSSLFPICSVTLYNFLTNFFSDYFFTFPQHP